MRKRDSLHRIGTRGLAMLVLVPALVFLASSSAAQPLNIVVLMTDDQRYDSLWAMPITTQRIGGRGLTFPNAFVTTPMCCPARASFLAGGYTAAQTGVLTNRAPNGSPSAFNSFVTLPLTLYRAGYRTAMIGKYMNNYRDFMPTIPPGWTWWREASSYPLSIESSGWRRSWFDYFVQSGRSTDAPGRSISTRQTQYLTDYITDESVRFVSTIPEPFFLYAAFPAPHLPATPAPEDATEFSSYTFTSPSYGEADLSDKPQWVQQQARQFARLAPAQQEATREQLRSLLSTDRGIGRIMDALGARGLLGRTLIIFTSDNGYLWGEHGLFSKGTPYEEAIRVPLIMALPGGVQNVTSTASLVAIDLDVPATIIEAAGVRHRTEGLSLLSHLRGGPPPARTSLVFQHWSMLDAWLPGFHGWTMIRTPEWKYVTHDDGSRELYDLRTDPAELNSVVTSPEHQATVTDLSGKLTAGRGLTMETVTLPAGKIGVPYRVDLKGAGGTRPYHWKLEAGELPRGLQLSTRGVLLGTPAEAGRYAVILRVSDRSVRKHAGGPQTFARDFILTVQP